MKTPHQIDKLIEDFNQPGDKGPQAAVASLVKLGPKALRRLIESLRSGRNTRIRRWSADALGGIGDPRAVDPLIAAFSDENMSVILHAIWALFALEAKGWGRHLLPLMRHPSGGVRSNAIGAVAALGYGRAAGALIEATRDEKWYIRMGAARALGELKVKRAAGILKKLCDDDRKAVRVAAEQALGNL